MLTGGAVTARPQPPLWLLFWILRSQGEPPRAQTYNPRSSLTTLTFWKNGVLMATVDAAICFFISYYATSASGAHMATDVWSTGKTTFITLLGARLRGLLRPFRWQDVVA